MIFVITAIFVITEALHKKSVLHKNSIAKKRSAQKLIFDDARSRCDRLATPQSQPTSSSAV